MKFPPRAAFRKWLQSFSPEAVIATKWGQCDCPLARWLTPRIQADFVEIVPEMTGWRIGNDSEWHKLPLWAIDFADEVDSDNPVEGDVISAGVTAAECLLILDATSGRSR